MREYDEHDDLNYRAGSHGKCRREPIDVFERGQLYNSGSECDEQYKRKLEHLRERTFTNGTTLSPTYTPSAADKLAGSVTLTLPQ